MRTNLKVLRIRLGLTQEQMSEKIGWSRAAYSAIESGAREGRQAFWKSLQKTLDVPEAEMWELMKNE